MRLLDIIKNTYLFKNIPEKYQRLIAQMSITRRYKKGEIIFLENKSANGFYLILSGSIKIFKLSSEGKEQILRILRPFEIFGEAAVFSNKNFPASAMAIEDTEILFIPKKDFSELIKKDYQLALNMLSTLSERLVYFTNLVENLSLKNVNSRLATYLIDLFDENQNNDEIILNISKSQLANLLGTVPETLSRSFKYLSKKRIIEIKGNRIKILNLLKLRDVAEN